MNYEIINPTRKETAIEWMRCLASPRHAQTTWLRIDSEDEQKAHRVINAVIAALFIACVVFFMVGAIRFHNRPVIIEYQSQSNTIPTQVI